MSSISLPRTTSWAPLASRLRAMLTQETIATLVVSVIVGAAVLLPLFTLIVSSFQVMDADGFDTTWGFANYTSVLNDRVIRQAFINTLLISSGTTVLATFLGVSLAWINARTNCPWRDRLEPYNLIPFFLSPFVGAIAWHNLAAPRVGLLNSWAKRLSRHFGPAQRRQYLRRHLGDGDLLHAAGLSVRGRLAAPHGPFAGGLRAHHRRRPVAHHHDGDPAAGRAGDPVGRHHRLRHQRRRIRRAVQARRALRLADADHADLLQGGGRRRQLLSRLRHEHVARRHHRLLHLYPAALYRAALVHHRDRQGLPPQRHRPRALALGRLRLQPRLHRGGGDPADPLPADRQPASGLAGQDHLQRHVAAQLRARRCSSGAPTASRRRPTASTTASSWPSSAPPSPWCCRWWSAT